jgi:outer membrane protein OmpA-like peptidoglycan-associated protein
MPPHLRKSARAAALALAVCSALAAPRAEAQQQLVSAPLDLQVFRPAIDSKGYITLNSSQVLGQLDFSFGLVSTWGSRVLDLTNTAAGNVGASGEPRRFAVHNMITPSLQGAVGLFTLGHIGLELGLVIPLTIMSGRGYPTDPGPTDSSVDNNEYTFADQGLGDIVVHPKLRLMNAARNKLGLAVIPSIVLPTGDDKGFLGEGQMIFQPTAVLDVEFGYLGRFRIAVNGGMRIRSKEARFVDDGAMFTAPRMFQGVGGTNTNLGLRVKNEAIGGLGVSFGVVPQKFDLVGEVYGAFGMGAQKLEGGADTGSLPPIIEALAGIKLYMARNSFFLAGGGWRLASDTYGAAAPRAFVGFIFEPNIGDRDGDGYKDDVDKCPDDPEDFDDFEDADGCPDPDNDKDKILDEDDRCPNDPETYNGFQDVDGCPDTTTNDRDGDGIPDNVDKCPDDPEDRDNFEDEDGCPDPDNDKDGILDINDLCPNDPEDKDNWEDADGCPDPDNDRDRILDASDKCPNEPETYNGMDDDDGCPDKGRIKVGVTKLEIMDKIYFETDKDEIKPISFPLLDAIAATIKGNPQLQLLEIQGHADERGDDAHNLDLTERRALSVKRALYERNVEPGRLKSHGYGETKPVCTQHSEDCWSRNRRVEFIILKRADEPQLQGGEGQ